MATKINLIHQEVPNGAVFSSGWLAENKVSRKEQVSYVKSGWLVRIAQGVYHFAGENPSLYDALSSYGRQTKMDYHLCASTALELKGYSHFVPMGKPRAYISSSQKRLPTWLLLREWDMEIHYFTTGVLGDIGIEDFTYGDLTLRISSPERAIMECLLLAPAQYTLMDVYYLMEMLSTLRPKLLTRLLTSCTSVKVKRLFLYMAEKTNFQWLKAIDMSAVTLGTGTRSIEEGGKLIEKYKIVVSKELAEYE